MRVVVVVLAVVLFLGAVWFAALETPSPYLVHKPVQYDPCPEVLDGRIPRMPQMR